MIARSTERGVVLGSETGGGEGGVGVGDLVYGVERLGSGTGTRVGL